MINSQEHEFPMCETRDFGLVRIDRLQNAYQLGFVKRSEGNEPVLWIPRGSRSMLYKPYRVIQYLRGEVDSVRKWDTTPKSVQQARSKNKEVERIFEDV